jgi:hypothetical protein
MPFILYLIICDHPLPTGIQRELVDKHKDTPEAGASGVLDQEPIKKHRREETTYSTRRGSSPCGITSMVVSGFVY